MGRPESNTVDFFPHKISSGKKMFFIEQKYANDGYAVWFKVLEKIAETENHFLNLNEEEEIMYLSAKCNVEENRLIDIINDISRIGGFDKNLWNSKIIWSEKFYQEIQPAYRRRNSKCMDYQGLCIHLKSLCIISDDRKTQSRVDKSRVEESKDSIDGQENPASSERDLSSSEKCQLFINRFNELRLTAKGKNSNYQVTDSVCSSLKARRKKYTSSQIIQVIKRAINDEYHIKTANKYLTPSYILRQDIIERYLNQ